MSLYINDLCQVAVLKQGYTVDQCFRCQLQSLLSWWGLFEKCDPSNQLCPFSEYLLLSQNLTTARGNNPSRPGTPAVQELALYRSICCMCHAFGSMRQSCFVLQLIFRKGPLKGYLTIALNHQAQTLHPICSERTQC